MERSKKLLSNSLILLFGTILIKGLNFFMAPLFTRWVPIEDYGTFDLLITYSALLIPLLALGIHHAIFRFLLDNESKDEISAINTSAIITNIIGIIIYAIFVIILSIFFKSITNYIIQLTILILTQTFQNYIYMFVRGLKKIKLYTIMNIICTISILAFVFCFVKIFNMGLNGMIFGYSMGYFTAGLIGAIATHNFKYFSFKKFNKAKTKKMIAYAIPMIPNSIAWWIVNISDRVIVSTILGATANAILAVAHKIPNLCVALSDVFQTAWVENASEAIKDKDWNDYFSKMLNVISQFCISIAIIIVTTNFFLYDFLFTQDYASGRYLIPLFAFAIIFNVLSQTLGSVFVAEYNSKRQGITMLESGVINIIIHLLLIKFIGIYASAVSTIIAYIFLFTVRYKDSKKKYKIKIDKNTIILAIFLLVCIVFSYLNIQIINIILLIISIVFCIIMNKQIIKIIIKKIMKTS